jgi:multidrug efflux pump subunit AcrA (membrane-fusion protein)
LQDILNSNTSLAQAELDVVTAQKSVETALNTFQGLDYPRASDNLIQSTLAQIWAQQVKVTLATRAYKQVQNHPDTDPQKSTALLALTSAQTALDDLNALYNWYTGKPTPEDYAQAKAQLDLARAQLDDAKRTRDNVKSGSDPLKISAAQAKVTAAQATVNTMYIIAPFDGEVLSIQAGAGNSVALGDSAVELVDRQTLKVATLVDETNISSVVVGNPATLTFDSLPNVTLTGKVTGINRIGATVNGLVKYTVVVSVDPTTKPILFGATANVTITTGAPHSMLAVPISAVGTSTTSEYVMVVAADGSTRRVAVVSGDLIGNVVTVTPSTAGSLKSGDQVELGIATSSSSSSGGGGGGGGGFGGPGG